jgi:hypothetical protein
MKEPFGSEKLLNISTPKKAVSTALTRIERAMEQGFRHLP